MKGLCTAVVPWIATVIVASGYLASAGSPQLPSTTRAASADPRAVLDRYCVSCHNERTRTAGLALDAIDTTNVGPNAQTWEKVVRKLRSRTMPPASSPQPDEATYDAVSSQLERELDRLAAAQPNPGRLPAFHRLTRTEYRNAIRDLLAVEALPKAVDLNLLLPADNSSSGFDNLADLLFVSTTQLEQYLSAARKISRLAVGDATVRLLDTYLMSSQHSQDGHVEELPVGTRGGLAIRTLLPFDGEYKIHVELTRSPREPEQLEIAVDGERVLVFIASSADPGQASNAGGAADQSLNKAPKLAAQSRPDLDPGIPIQVDAVDPGKLEEQAQRRQRGRGFDALVPLKAGPREIGVTFITRSSGPSETPVLLPARAEGALPGVASVTVQGPQNLAGPGADTPSRRRIFVCRPAGGGDEQCAREILLTLARRAYRRPVTDQDLQPLLASYRAGRSDGFETGIRHALERVLVSPQFLFRIERDPATVAPGGLYRLSDIELASRLSFFLWSSLPDDELLSVAADGKLKDPVVLERQVRRMLADSRSGTLATNFGAQWLFLHDVEARTPIPRLFPDFDLTLMQDFESETELFLKSVFAEDHSVLDLLRADYTFVNERLARHYGIQNVFGTNFRRVTYGDDSPRRGLLGQGSILMLTSHPNRTSPVLRGKYVLSNILGAPPPPPPPNVPALVVESKASGKLLSMRDAMAQHRSNPACANCHARMDPIGFALENFDATGRWRTADESGTSIDTSGVFPDGTKFNGMVGLRQVLLRRPEQFVTTMTEKLFTYALGRTPEYYDAPVVRGIVRDAASSDYRFSSLVMGIVTSTPFQKRAKGDR